MKVIITDCDHDSIDIEKESICRCRNGSRTETGNHRG